MVKYLAELHEGTVGVASAVGQGSCFTVWLPLRRAPRTAGHRGARGKGAPDLPAEAPVALVVEDGTKTAALIRLQLEAEGFAVRHASSGDAALVLAAQQPLSLIALHLVLPDMDAWEFLGRLKQMPVRRTPVVVFSNVPDDTSGCALGAAVVLQKPVSRHDFFQSIDGLGLLRTELAPPRTILLVDDDPTAVDLLADVLGPDGTVLRASGAEAIEVARRELPAVIVLDLTAPDVDGFDVAEALRRQPDTAGIPILILTDAEMSAGGRAWPGGHATAVIEKPALDVERFTAEVRRAMSGRLLTVGSMA
jgi:CheY-like chemotaxis protein